MPQAYSSVRWHGWQGVGPAHGTIFAARGAPEAARHGGGAMHALHPVADPLLPPAPRAYLQKLLCNAGMAAAGWQPVHIAALQLLSCLAAGAVIAVLAHWGGLGAAHAAWATVLGAATGLWWPCQRITERARKRQAAITRQLPFMLDMATLCIEAGQNLQGALQQAATYGPPGPMRDELRHALADVRTGVPRIQALRGMAARCGVPPLHSLVALLAQAEHMGMSVGPLLRAHAEQRRSERFLRAEKRALEAPVKMLLPLVTCIFPCTFLVIAFPIGHRLIQAGF